MDKTQLIKKFEGLKLEAYQCSAGVWTIGYGHTGLDVFEGKVITEEDANNLLEKDVELFESVIKSFVKVPLNDNQFAALLSLVYNIGIDAFLHSTMLKRINRSDVFASDEFMRWYYVRGKPNNGLLNRRVAEKTLFDTKMEDKNDKSV